MTRLRLAPLLCLLLALAGCGGGGTSANEYRAQAEEICTSATREAAGVPPPSDTAASVAEYGDAVAGIRERETVALDELDPPDELQAAHRQLVNASGAIVRSLTDLRAAAELELPLCGQPGRAQG